MRIQHNIMAMNAYRNYTNNVNAMKKNLEKLSSGYKINRAGDDAAGLAISEKMRAQITGLETAQKNAKDGISLVQTAEGALTEVHDMLNRMVELATQSANGTYDNTTDRAQLQKEMDQLKTEINRISDSANFNGIKLLDGSMEEGSEIKVSLTGKNNLAILATGAANTQGTHTILHKDAKDATKTSFELEMSNVTFTSTTTTPAAMGTVAITIGNVSFTITATAEGLSGNKLAQAIYEQMLKTSGIDGDEDKMETVGLELQTGVNYSVKVDGDKLVFEMTDSSMTTAKDAASFQAPVTVSVTTAGSIAGLGDNHTDWKLSNIKIGAPEGGSVLADTAMNTAWTKAHITDGKGLKIGDTTYVFALTEKTAKMNFGEGYKVIDLTDICTDGAADTNKLPGTNGSDNLWVQTALSRVTEAAADNKMFSVQLAAQGKLSFREKMDYDGDADLTTLKGIQKQIQTFDKVSAETISTGKGTMLTLQIGDTAEDFNQLKVNIKDMHTGAMGIDGISIADQTSAAKAVEAIKSAINYVSDIRGTLGATQNRLDHTINNLSVMTENIQDAESTIRDTDVAAEMMAYTKNNILIQSAQAMLAQANQVPQGVLQLLG